MEEQIKLCKDCKHYVKEGCKSASGLDLSKCRIAVWGRDVNYLVNGRNMFIQYCLGERMVIGNCKPEALLFEPKLSMWYKLKNFFKGTK